MNIRFIQTRVDRCLTLLPNCIALPKFISLVISTASYFQAAVDWFTISVVHIGGHGHNIRSSQVCSDSYTLLMWFDFRLLVVVFLFVSNYRNKENSFNSSYGVGLITEKLDVKHVLNWKDILCWCWMTNGFGILCHGRPTAPHTVLSQHDCTGLCETTE